MVSKKKVPVTKEISKKTKIILDEPNKSKIETVEKKKFLVCPFCQERSYTAQGRDETSTWCPRCGKCYSRFWQEG